MIATNVESLLRTVHVGGKESSLDTLLVTERISSLKERKIQK